MAFVHRGIGLVGRRLSLPSSRDVRDVQFFAGNAEPVVGFSTLRAESLSHDAWMDLLPFSTSYSRAAHNILTEGGSVSLLKILQSQSRAQSMISTVKKDSNTVALWESRAKRSPVLAIISSASSTSTCVRADNGAIPPPQTVPENIVLTGTSRSQINTYIMPPALGSTTLELPRWDFADVTTCIPEEDYVDLEVVDISDFMTTPTVSATSRGVIAHAFESFQRTGFVVMTGHGLTGEAISRQFDLGKMFLEVSEETKQQYHAKISEEGSWAGYKPQGFHKRSNGARDTTEFHDFYPNTVAEELQPPVSWPYLDEIKMFYSYNHFKLLRAVLYILSEGLGLPPDSLWHLHHPEGDLSNTIHTKDMFRAGIYHPPLEEDREKSKRLWLPPHTDRGSVTFLYSQPIAGLQVFIDGGWKYVRHYPNGIIVNAGDMLEFVTGRLVKSALHRVHEPPPDQRHLRRLGLFYFATMRPDIRLEPLELLASRAKPLETDVFHEFGGRVPTAEEWQVRRAKTTGKPADRELFKQRFPTHLQDNEVRGNVETTEI